MDPKLENMTLPTPILAWVRVPTLQLSVIKEAELPETLILILT